jgi:hypothetical protein
VSELLLRALLKTGQLINLAHSAALIAAAHRSIIEAGEKTTTTAITLGLFDVVWA